MSRVPPHSDGEVAASYADGGVMGDSRGGAYDPSAPYDGAPPHLNGEESDQAPVVQNR